MTNLWSKKYSKHYGQLAIDNYKSKTIKSLLAKDHRQREILKKANAYITLKKRSVEQPVAPERQIFEIVDRSSPPPPPSDYDDDVVEWYVHLA